MSLYIIYQKRIMQVIVFDKFFKCLYKIKNVPNDWHFDTVAKLLGLEHNPSEYQAIRLADSKQWCTEEYVYKDGEFKLTEENCY